jgi:hypothetical protein
MSDINKPWLNRPKPAFIHTPEVCPQTVDGANSIHTDAIVTVAKPVQSEQELQAAAKRKEEEYALAAAYRAETQEILAAERRYAQELDAKTREAQNKRLEKLLQPTDTPPAFTMAYTPTTLATLTPEGFNSVDEYTNLVALAAKLNDEQDQPNQ